MVNFKASRPGEPTRRVRKTITLLVVPAIAVTTVAGLATAGMATASPAAAASADAVASSETARVPIAFSPASQPASRAGGAMISGRRWLGGKGVDVLRGRQCTELATRLYGARRWGSLNNIYGMRPGRVYDRKLVFHRNGSGYLPVPGDVLVELGGSYQHVAVVNQVTRKAIHTVEQNAVPSGRHLYGWNGKRAVGAYGPRHVGGFIHSLRNPYGKDSARPGKSGKGGQSAKRTR